MIASNRVRGFIYIKTSEVGTIFLSTSCKSLHLNENTGTKSQNQIVTLNQVCDKKQHVSSIPYTYKTLQACWRINRYRFTRMACSSSLHMINCSHVTTWTTQPPNMYMPLIHKDILHSRCSKSTLYMILQLYRQLLRFLNFIKVPLTFVWMIWLRLSGIKLIPVTCNIFYFFLIQPGNSALS